MERNNQPPTFLNSNYTTISNNFNDSSNYYLIQDQKKKSKQSKT